MKDEVLTGLGIFCQSASLFLFRCRMTMAVALCSSIEDHVCIPSERNECL